MKDLFKKYQKLILAFANTSYGKAYLDIKADYPIWKLTPDGWHEHHNGILRATFHSKNPFINKLSIPLQSINIAADLFDFSRLTKNLDLVIANYLGLVKQKDYLPKVMFATDTFNPDADPETNSVDGFVSRVVGSEETWATIRGGAGTASDDSSTTMQVGARSDNVNNRYTQMRRIISCYNTASLGASATISAATESFYCTAATGNPTYWPAMTVRLVATTPASSTALASADYGNTGTSSIASAEISIVSPNNWTTSAYNDYTVSSPDSNVSKTGVTKHGLRYDLDADNTDPNLSTYGLESYVTVNQADAGSNKPKLVVTYTSPDIDTNYSYFM